MTQTSRNIGAPDGNRTRITCLGSKCSTTELQMRIIYKCYYIIFETKFELSKEIIENFNLQFKIEDGLYIYNRKENFEKVL